MFKRLFRGLSIVTIAVLLPFSNAYCFDLNKILNGLPKSSGQTSGNNTPQSANQNSANPFGALMGAMSGASNNTEEKGSSMAGFVCADFVKKAPDILYSSQSSEGIITAQNEVARDFTLDIENTRRLLQDGFETNLGASWVYHYKAKYSSSFLNKKVKATFAEYTNKPELRLEMAARIKKAAFDNSLKKDVRGEALFAYALILARFENVHNNKGLIEELLKKAFRFRNVGAQYVKALRLYNGYGVRKDVNAAANFSVAASSRVDELNEEAERLDMPTLTWESPSELVTLNLTDKEYNGHGRYASLAASGERMRQSIEASLKSNKMPLVRREAERLASKFDEAADQLAEIYGISGDVAAERLKFQTAKARLDQDQQVLETQIAMRKSTAGIIEEAIGKADSGLREDAEKKAKEIRSQFDALASRSFSLIINATANFSLSDDLLFAMKTADRMRTDGCRFVYAMDEFFKRSNVAFSDEEKMQLGRQTESSLEDEIPPDDGS